LLNLNASPDRNPVNHLNGVANISATNTILLRSELRISASSLRKEVIVA
jgi:hypothetical protein